MARFPGGDRLAAQQRHVEAIGAGRGTNRRCRVRANDTGVGAGLGQRNLDVEQRLERVSVRERGHQASSYCFALALQHHVEMIAAFAVVRGNQRRASSGRHEREDRVRIVASVIRKVNARKVLRQDAAPEHVHGNVRSVNDSVRIFECERARHRASYEPSSAVKART